MRYKYLIIALLSVSLLLGASGCSSRYRMNLFLIDNGKENKIKVEQTEYISDAILGKPLDEIKVVNGKGNCIILTTGSRGKTVKTSRETIVDYDTYLSYKIFLQLPHKTKPTNIILKNNSFVQLTGHYGRSRDEKMFLAKQGSMVVDSIADKYLFGNIDGKWENNQGDSLSFRGKFKVKVSR